MNEYVGYYLKLEYSTYQEGEINQLFIQVMNFFQDEKQNMETCETRRCKKNFLRYRW